MDGSVCERTPEVISVSEVRFKSPAENGALVLFGAWPFGEVRILMVRYILNLKTVVATLRILMPTYSLHRLWQYPKQFRHPFRLAPQIDLQNIRQLP